jgi:hypothetical protein
MRRKRPIHTLTDQVRVTATEATSSSTMPTRMRLAPEAFAATGQDVVEESRGHE